MQLTIQSGAHFCGLTVTQRERSHSAPHCRDRSGVREEPFRVVVALAYGVDLLWNAMPVTFPIDAQMALEAGLFERRKTPPDRLGLRTQRVHDDAPVETAPRRLLNCERSNARRATALTYEP